MRVLILGLSLLLSTASLASQPDPIKSSEAMHKRATKAYKSGQRAVAAGLWREALKVRPFWKYGYNLANTLYELKRATEAWNALQRTTALGVPTQYNDRLVVLREKVSAELLTDHAFIALEVPPGAIVTRSGLPWLAPRTKWSRDAQSKLVVTKPGFRPQSFTWAHPIGQRWQRRVTLQKQGPGRLVIAGAPPGATVSINGKPERSIDQFRLSGLALEPGHYDLVIQAPGHRADKRSIRLAADTEKRITAVLISRVPKPEPEPVPDGHWVTAGIVTGAVGGVALLTGGILLGLAETERAELTALSSNATRLKELGYQGYVAEHGAGVERFEQLNVAGWVTLSVGIVAVVTGVAVALGAPDVPAKRGAPVLSWNF